MASPPVIHQCINVVILSHKKIVNIKKCSSNMLSFVSERINHPCDTLYTKLQAATSLSIFADVNNCLPRMFFSRLNQQKLGKTVKRVLLNSLLRNQTSSSSSVHFIYLKKRKKKKRSILLSYSNACYKVIGCVLYVGGNVAEALGFCH